jgi:hypothetical protein
MTYPAAFLTAAALIIGLAAALSARAAQADAAAPLFEADSSIGKVALADFLGKKNVLLAFYFKDFTGG